MLQLDRIREGRERERILHTHTYFLKQFYFRKINTSVLRSRLFSLVRTIESLMRCEFICLLKTWRPNTAQAVVCSQNDVFHILQPMGRDQLINRVVVNHAKMAVSNFERKKCFAGDFHVLCSNFNDHNTFTPDVRKSQKKNQIILLAINAASIDILAIRLSFKIHSIVACWLLLAENSIYCGDLSLLCWTTSTSIKYT